MPIAIRKLQFSVLKFYHHAEVRMCVTEGILCAQGTEIIHPCVIVLSRIQKGY